LADTAFVSYIDCFGCFSEQLPLSWLFALIPLILHFKLSKGRRFQDGSLQAAAIAFFHYPKTARRILFGLQIHMPICSQMLLFWSFSHAAQYICLFF
jgi:hypothetical protein